MYEVVPVADRRGAIHGRQDTSKIVAFKVSDPALIRKVLTGSDKTEPKVVPFRFLGDSLFVTIPFTETGDYPLYLYVNGAVAFVYKAQVSKKAKSGKRG